MQNKKMMVLVVLGMIAIVSIIYGAVTPSKIRRQIKEASKKEALARSLGETSGPQASASVPATLSAAPLPSTAAVKQRPPRSSFKDWGRNPFLRQDILELKGILWDEENPKAVINDNITAVGDLVSGSLVVEIRKDGVVLYDGSSDFELRLKE